MKYQMSIAPLDRGSKGYPASESSTERDIPRSPVPDWAEWPTSTIEELTGAPPTRAKSQPDRWLRLAIAGCAAVICYGFAGRVSGPPPVGVAMVESSPSPSSGQTVLAMEPQVAAFVLVSPIEGEISAGGAVSVRGIANEPLRNLHLAVVLGMRY